MRHQKERPADGNRQARKPCGNADSVPSGAFSRKDFIGSLIASLLTTAVALADSIGDTSTVDEIARLKIRHGRRARE